MWFMQLQIGSTRLMAGEIGGDVVQGLEH